MDAHDAVSIGSAAASAPPGSEPTRDRGSKRNERRRGGGRCRGEVLTGRRQRRCHRACGVPWHRETSSGRPAAGSGASQQERRREAKLARARWRVEPKSFVGKGVTHAAAAQSPSDVAVGAGGRTAALLGHAERLAALECSPPSECATMSMVAQRPVTFIQCSTDGALAPGRGETAALLAPAAAEAPTLLLPTADLDAARRL